MSDNYDINVKELISTKTNLMHNYQFNLIVWNDEVNTFDWVIDSLMEVCNHSEEQAEQCALFIHFKGKYPVKNGEFDAIKIMCEAICERGINATIEELANSNR